MQVAKTILNQIKVLTPQQVFWSWGASKFQAIGENQIEGIKEEYSGGLMFYVRGMKHKGHVLVSLTWRDTYTVSIGSVRKGKINPKKEVTDVHFNELPDVIDNLIEKQDNYAY